MYKDPYNQFRLFISSTFKDMDKERSYIVEWIFPRIKELCDERGVEFFPIDLRWGITEQEGKQGRIISACLEEVDNSRPYFIGLLGDRYGWQPSLSDLGESSTVLLERYPWLEKDINQELSITEIEMRYGALRQNDSNAVFYIRKEAKENIMYHTIKMIASTDYRHLHRLKLSIKNNKHVQYREFVSPEELGEMVYQDTKAVIEERFSEKLPTFQETLHGQSFKSHLTNFVNLDAYHQKIEQILNSLNDDSKFLVLRGMKGAGKSTVLCTFIEKYKEENPSNNILYYDITKAFMNPLIGWSKNGHLCENSFANETKRFFEMVDKDLSRKDVLNRMIDVLTNKNINEPDEKLNQSENLENIIALDNVEYLRYDKHKIFINELINHKFPTKTKVIVTHLDFEFNPYHTSLEDITESYISIDSLNARKIHITGMRREEIPTFVERYLKSYGKKLTHDQLMRFTKPLYAINPYYLKLALFQLVELGSFEKLDETINYLTGGDSHFDNELECWNWSVTTPITYILDNVIGRDMGNYGNLMLIMWLMFLNRYSDGFTERELIDILHLSPAHWALLRPQVMEICRHNNGHIEFSDNLFSLILGRISYENMAKVQEMVIKYLETIPRLEELETKFKQEGKTTLSAIQKSQVKQSLRKAQLLSIYKEHQKMTISKIEKDNNVNI